MMAPYAIGHLKTGFVLDEFGYKLTQDERFNLFLTNTLDFTKEDPNKLPGILEQTIAKESSEALEVKENIPIMVILGNPPYSGISENKGKWILKQIEEYKQIDDKPLGERKHWLQDDYVKFFRFAQWKIEHTGAGVIGFITNHAWLDNPTFRGMRYSFLKTFDEIYILNLHGSTLKKEKTPEDSKDENVFDIQSGVTISILTRNNKKRQKKIYYADLWGLRDKKYKWLENHDIESTDWEVLIPSEPYYFFVKKERKGLEVYQNFTSLKDIFPVNSTGIVTSRDNFVIDHDRNTLKSKIIFFLNKNNSDDQVKEFLRDILGKKEVKDIENYEWRVSRARQELSKVKDMEHYFTKILYRPFDDRWIYYHRAIVWRTRESVMKNMLYQNLALMSMRQVALDLPYTHFLATDKIADNRSFLSAKGIMIYFPLYIYKEEESKQISLLIKKDEIRSEKRPNIKNEILNSLESYSNKKPLPEEIFYYIYSILYSDTYRKKYQEFLKIDFPKIPFTNGIELFTKLAELGKELVDLHLLKSSDLNNPIARYFGEDDNIVEKHIYKEHENRVYINNHQYFNGIKPEVWNYHIGGYQVLNKWLKDRKSRMLSSEEIKKYCKIVTAISNTIIIQNKIDKMYPEVEKNILNFEK